MEITIKTKFDYGSNAYGFYNGKVWKFYIDNINIKWNNRRNQKNIYYECTAVVPKNWHETFHCTFEEYELYTKEELMDLMTNIPGDEDNKEDGQHKVRLC